jgi:hypothetical protein
MQEVFFSAKGLGRKHPEKFKSPNSDEDSPKELELPDAMPVLVASHVSYCGSPLISGCVQSLQVAGALHNWKTGRCQNSDFTQERLEATYNSLLKLIDSIREDTPELCHSVMHDLYNKTTYVYSNCLDLFSLITLDARQSQSVAAVASLGSARNVVRLDLADDED